MKSVEDCQKLTGVLNMDVSCYGDPRTILCGLVNARSYHIAHAG